MSTKKVKVMGSAVVIVLMVIFFSACASNSRYISKPTVPPPDLSISSRDDNLGLNLNYVIVPDGPGSWVKGARWDEYVLTVRNISNKPVTVESIRLIDPRGLYIESNINPWQLEKASEALAEQYKDMGISTTIAVAAQAAGYAAAAAGAWAVVPVTGLAMPAYLFGKEHSQVKDREEIEREFTRRQLSTFTLSGNATIQGSALFPIIPNPKALVVDYRIGNKMRTLEVSLEKLQGLHIAPDGK